MADSLQPPAAQRPATASPQPRWRRLWQVVLDGLRPAPPTPAPYDWFSEAEVAAYHRLSAPDPALTVDDRTWSDLQVDIHLRLLGSGASLFARQQLYHRLRVGSAPGIDHREALGRPTVAVLQACAAPRWLLRCVRIELATALFAEALPALPSWADRLWLMPAALVVALLLALAGQPQAAVLLVLACVAAGAFVVTRLAAPLRRWQALREGLWRLLSAGVQLAEGPATLATAPPSLRRLGDAAARLRRQWRALAPSAFERIPALAEYLNLVALQDYTRMRRQLAALRAGLPALRQSFEAIARCEADLCLAEHHAALARVCWAEAAAGHSLALHEAVHPQLQAGWPLTLQIEGQGVFLSGQNGVGKSTWLRAVGLNLMNARAFGFCYARAAQVPLLPVWTSIENQDSLLTADSLYMAELRRAEALVRAARRPAAAVFIVDELFRGTNPIESTAAAAGVLAALARQAIVLVASHDLRLAQLLRGRLVGWRIVRDAAPAGALRLEPGQLEHTNGIALMAGYDFPPAVLQAAQAAVHWLLDGDADAQPAPEL